MDYNKTMEDLKEIIRAGQSLLNRFENIKSNVKTDLVPKTQEELDEFVKAELENSELSSFGDILNRFSYDTEHYDIDLPLSEVQESISRFTAKKKTMRAKEFLEMYTEEEAAEIVTSINGDIIDNVSDSGGDELAFNYGTSSHGGSYYLSDLTDANIKIEFIDSIKKFPQPPYSVQKQIFELMKLPKDTKWLNSNENIQFYDDKTYAGFNINDRGVALVVGSIADKEDIEKYPGLFIGEEEKDAYNKDNEKIGFVWVPLEFADKFREEFDYEAKELTPADVEKWNSLLQNRINEIDKEISIDSEDAR